MNLTIMNCTCFAKVKTEDFFVSDSLPAKMTIILIASENSDHLMLFNNNNYHSMQAIISLS